MTCFYRGSAPFDHVRLIREREENGEPNGWVELVGQREGGERTVRVLCADLWMQMQTHVERYHGKRLSDPLTFEELEHATVRAAVAFLRD